jgi:hypothetical protein
MGVPRPARPVKLFAGLLGSDLDVLRRTKQLLARQFGPVDLESEVWPFDCTDYYETEMGPNLQRWFLSFERLIRPDQIGDVKLETNQLEQEIAESCLPEVYARIVNIDPGYLELGKVVLATTKDRSHRLYVGNGIYAEVTLHFVEGQWQPWPWTYADYATEHYREFFARARARFLQQRQQNPEMFADRNASA